VEERKPFPVVLACWMESMLLESENGPENESELIAPTPLPMRIPEGVEEPVPPFATPRAVARFKLPKFANCEKRFVDEAVVEKKLVEVALPSVTLPEKVVVPEKVLLSMRSVVEAELPPTQVPLIEKHPLVRLMPPVAVKVDVANEKLMPTALLVELPTERIEPGVVVPMPTLPEKYDCPIDSKMLFFVVVALSPTITTYAGLLG
jgi:hypothetical protein